MASIYGEGQAAPPSFSRDPSPRRSRERWRSDARHPGERSLSRLIEGEIIPRLMVAHPVEPFIPGRRADRLLPGDVAAFVPLVLQVEADQLMTHVERLLDRGIAVEALLVDLLAPAARALGDLWVDDRADFVEVTMGLWRLQEVVHELAGRAPAARCGPQPGRHALFAPAPGEQHGFGALVVEEVFAREGWTTDRIAEPRVQDLVERVAGEWFDLVGLTVSCDSHTGALPAVIAAMRNVSRNPRLCVMVGGRVFIDDPGLAGRVGADATAVDARVATQVAAGLVDAVALEVAQVA